MRQFLLRTFAVFGIGTLFILALAILWNAASVLLLLFAAVLMGNLLIDASTALEKFLHIRHGFALALTLILALLFFGGLGWLFAPQISQQTDQLMVDIPASVDRLRDYLDESALGRAILDTLPSPSVLFSDSSLLIKHLSNFFSGVFGAVADFVIIFFAGIYLAAQPKIYADGLIKLLPQAARPRGREVLDELSRTLRLWLRGKVFSMAAIGVTTTLGLALLGVPLALSLGLIAGLLDFIPYLGPILASIPGILIALSQSPELALYTALLFIFLHTLDGYILLPMVERHTVAMFPGVTISLQVLLGLNFGLTGVALATPLAAVLTVLIEMLYVQDCLGDRVKLPSEH
jgi:predicted PurR-regulated permease PerM